MYVYIVFVFDNLNYPSTTEYVAIFSTEEKANKYIKENKYNYNSSFQELYFEKKYVE